jgi:ABC-2 type transport system permease protein
VDVLGVLPFCAIGLFIGSLVSGQGAPAVANLIYLPMSFLSGLWMPLGVLPAFIGKMAPLWPAYHLGRLALGAVGQAPGEHQAMHVLALALFTVVFLALARRRLARA